MSGVYLAFDYGLKRIGVAVGDAVTRSARSLSAVPEDWTALTRILKEWQPSACVVGLPLDLSGHEQDITRRARVFAKELETRSGKPVHLADERYSSRSALESLREARASGAMTRRVRKGDKDGEAARLILQQWLSEQGEQKK